MTKERLKLLAEKLMFTMNEEEYDTLLNEFDIILKQMELIEKIDNINEVEPMTFPFPIEGVNLREDIVEDELSIEDILSNSENVKYNQIKLPKVVE